MSESITGTAEVDAGEVSWRSAATRSRIELIAAIGGGAMSEAGRRSADGVGQASDGAALDGLATQHRLDEMVVTALVVTVVTVIVDHV